MGQGAGRALRAAGARLGQVLGEVRAHEVEERGLLARRRPQGRPLPQRLPAASAPFTSQIPHWAICHAIASSWHSCQRTRASLRGPWFGGSAADL